MGTYAELLKGGWRMQDIDGMDFLGFLRVRAWDLSREKSEVQTPDGKVYIDDIF
jgi:hypothetical protein